ncbi:MAG: hypothetical protein K0S68_783, partial [Candidatus Saccharibacteria bacterium]|nr:hypothetical protein [Candidatus Saccharibacteria bacterium]
MAKLLDKLVKLRGKEPEPRYL